MLPRPHPQGCEVLIFKNLEEVKGCRRFNRVGISWVVIASSRHFEPAVGQIARALENYPVVRCETQVEHSVIGSSE